MKRVWIVLGAFVISALALHIIGGRGYPVTSNGQYRTEAKRIVSLAPSITESLFALDLGDRVVGVSRFCKYPLAALEKESIGGCTDLNYEKLLRLRPDLVVMMNSNSKLASDLEGKGIRCIFFDSSSMAEVLASIRRIGEAAGVPKRSEKLVASLESRIKRVHDAVSDLPKRRTMIVVARECGSGEVKVATIAGQNTFYNDLLENAGGANSFTGSGVDYPEVGVENILRMNPEVILDVFSDPKLIALGQDKLRADWKGYMMVDAVKEGRLFVLTEDYTTIPGPRVVELLERIAECLHPQLKLETKSR